ncbi:unnamed protein product [Haemonchus placei]|uniref:BAR domain-containing protein n=1 Tax=Haemonchus placei TaxID=6290 RepID=A0A0N4XBF8_HAEPC|nr:unnamed protein product [Haemonchus placei]
MDQPLSTMGNSLIVEVKAAGKIGIVEETKLEPAFEQGIKKVETYRLAVDCVLDGLEAIMQPNHKIVETGAIVAPPGQNPHELMATACTKMKRFLGNNEQVKNTKTKEELEEKGMFYHKSVKAFNDQASKIQVVIDELPMTIFTNQREIVKFFAQREKFHTSASDIMKDALKHLPKK